MDATKDMSSRAKKGNYVNLYGPNSWSIVSTCNTVEEADVLERQLNLEAGYEWNESRSYLNMLAFAAKGGRKKDLRLVKNIKKLYRLLNYNLKRS